MSDEQAEGTMTFWEHLEELRSRLVKAAAAFLVGSIVAWLFKERLLFLLTKPFVDGWHGAPGSKPSLHFPAPQSLFMAYIKLSLIGGAVLSLPFVLYQLWAFIAPGLYKKEKRWALPFVASSCLLFATGAYFGWRFVFPAAFDYLLAFTELPKGSPLSVQATVMVDEYLSFMLQALVAFGAVFEIPIVVFFLSAIGLIDHTHLIRFGRYFVVLAFVVSAIITPPDPLSQVLLAVPLLLLYGVSIGVAWLVARTRRKKAASS